MFPDSRYNSLVDYIQLKDITHGYSGFIPPKTCVPYKVESRFPVGTDAERYLLKAVFQSDDPIDADYGLAFPVNKWAVGIPYAKVGSTAVKPFEPFGVESRLVYFMIFFGVIIILFLEFCACLIQCFHFLPGELQFH